MNSQTQTQHLYHRAPIDPQNDNDSLAKIARLVPPGSVVLDVGCGVGRLGQHLAINQGCVVDGINANRAELELASPFYRCLWEWDLEWHHLPRSLLKRRYDIVVCADVLEHLREPGRLLQLLRSILQPTGKVLISIPNVGHIGVILELLGGDFHYRPEGLLDETHLRFFTRQSFLRFLKDYGFSGSIVDETVAPLQASEFAQWVTHLNQLNIGQDLNNDKIVYQYIVVATPQGNASMLPATLPAARHWSPSATVEVFWSSEGDQFSQERSHSLTMPLNGHRYQLIFNIPSMKIQRLRIDPINIPGDIWLYGLRLMGGDRILWSWDGTSQGVSSLEMQQLEILPYALAPQGIGLRASGIDPQILLSLPGSLLEQCTQVVLELKYIIQQDWHDALIRMQNQLEGLQDHLQKKNDEVSALSNTLGNTLRPRSWRVTHPMRAMVHVARTARETFRPGPLGQQNRYAIARGLYRALPLPKGLRNSVSRRLHVVMSQRTYTDWICNFDTLSESDRTAIHAQIASWDSSPRISVLMPVYNPPAKYLQLAIDSVCQQLYPHWELCIVDDASTDPKVREVLTRSAENDHRIKVKHRAENGHISAASNDALAMATGEYVALLDHDDLLTEHALYWVAATALANPHADLIYSDEDKIDEAGVRSDPYFKPDWNQELLLGQNYISHLGCYRRERVESIGGFRLGYEGSQDWDLVLRFTEGLDASHIVHIPAVLYHWRMLSSSTAVSLDAKPYAIEASRKAVLDHLERQGIAVDMEAVCNGVHHLPRFQVQGTPLVSIIIPTRNGFADLEICVESLDRTSWKNTELLIIDNQSDDPKTLEYLQELGHRPNVRVLRYPHPFDYAAMHNWAVPQAHGEFLCLLNNDTEVIDAEWLRDMLGQAQRPGVGAVGAKLLYPDDTVQHGGLILGIGGIGSNAHKHAPAESCGYFGRSALIQNFSAVTAACLVLAKVRWLEVGGMVPDLPVAFNDVDLCLRLMKSGYRNIWLPQARLYHYESKSRGSDISAHRIGRFALETAYMQWRWGKWLRSDPHYNPNLTLEREDFSLAWPPRVRHPWRQDAKIVDVPYGLPHAPSYPIELAPGSRLKGTFPIPVGIDGVLRGLSILLGAFGGASDGFLILTLRDDEGQSVNARASLNEAQDNSVFPFVFDRGDRFALHGQERLQFHLRLERATHPVALLSYPLNARWGHQIKGQEDRALRIELHVQEASHL